MPPRFYLAGPFFNPPQIELMKEIELAFCDAQIPFFSPRLQSGNQKKGPIDAARASEIFQSNMVNIHDCDAMLAVLDWKLPLDCAVVPGVFRNPQLNPPTFIQTGPPLHLPDSGTVYEMGYGHAKGIPIVGYTERTPDEPLNLMLTQGLRGVLSGMSELKTFLGIGKEMESPVSMRKPGVWWSKLHGWEGRNA